MKKITITIILIISIIITLSLKITLDKRGKGEAFPHFKQAIIKYSGSANAISKEKFKMPIIFVDESKMSELASVENLKEIYIVDSNGIKYPMMDYKIQDGVENKGYIMRNFEGNIIFKNPGIYELTNVKFKFLDNKIKDYPLGNFKVYVESKENFSNMFIGNIFPEYIFSKEKPGISGVMVRFDIQAEDIVLKNIDLGVDGLNVDKNNIIVTKDIIDINDFESKRNAKEFICFDSMRVTENSDSGYLDKKISKEYIKDNYIMLLIPITCSKEFNLKNTAIALNLKFTINSKGKDYELYSLQPLVYLPLINKDLKPLNLLKEEGK